MGSLGGLRRSQVLSAPWLLTALVVAYSTVNLLPHSVHQITYVPLNVAVGLALAIFAISGLGLDRESLGLTRQGLRRGLAAGAVTTAVIATMGAITLTIPETREAAGSDARVDELTLVGLVYAVGVRIPIGTAAFEEFLFRGVLLAVWLRTAGLRWALTWTSLAFGAWHVVPTLELLEANRSDAAPVVLAGVVAAGVVATTVSGALFSWLRLWSHGLVAPWLVHSAINAGALVTAWLAVP